MPPAPAITASPELDEFLGGLIASKVIDGGRARSARDAYFNEAGVADVGEFAEFLVRRGLLTPYQAERCATGETGKLVLGPYLLLEPLESHGFGTGFLAVHRGDRRRFAVRVLPLRSLWKVLQAKRQVESYRVLPEHRAIIPLAEVDTANGSHYLSWPFVEGETLSTILQRIGPMTAHDVCRVFADVADGLAIGHAAGIVHGMLSPACIAIGTDGRAGILDSGLGAIAAENWDDESLLDTVTLSKSAVGMLDWCAPETIAEPCVRTPATDAYSFGCVLFAALTALPPFVAESVVEKMLAHRTRSPVPLRTLLPGIAPALEELVQSLLAKDPERRPRLAEVKETLEALTNSVPVAASSTVPIGKLTLHVADLFGDDRQLPPEPDHAGSNSASAPAYTASQIFESSDGLIDFDVPGEVYGAETPLSSRPITPIHKPDSSAASRKPAPVTPKVADPSTTSFPELLLPVGGVLRTLSLPNTSAPPKSMSGPAPSKTQWEPPPAPVNWVATGAKSGIRVVRPLVVVPPVPQFDSPLVRGLRKKLLFWTQPGDTVQISIFGAPEIAAGQRVNFLVYAHSPEASSSVVTLSRALRPESELLGVGFLDAPVKRGIDVNLHLALTCAGVAKSSVKFTWVGQTQPRTFEVFVPWESPSGLASGVITAGIDKTMVASIPLHFVITLRQV